MAKFVVYRDSVGDFRWRFEAARGQVVADSHDGYRKKADLLDTILVVKREAASAQIEDPT